MGVLDDHDGIVDNDPQAEEEGKENDKIQGDHTPDHKFRRREKAKSNKHTQGNGQGHKEGIHYTHEEHQDDEHEDESDHNRVDEVIKGIARLSTLIAGDDYFEVGGEAFLHFLDDPADGVGGFYEVFA